MATSGVYATTTTRNDIVRRALRKVGIIGDGETMSTEQLSNGCEELNGIIEGDNNLRNKMWKREWVIHPFTDASEVTTGGKFYRCIMQHTSASDNEPDSGDEWTMYWIEDTSITSASAWANATAYTCPAQFSFPTGVMGIDQAFLRETNGADQQIEILSWRDFVTLPKKSSTGDPNYLAVDEALTPTVYLNPIPEDTDVVLHYIAIMAMEVFTSASETADMPNRWLDFLVHRLASRLADTYGDERGNRFWNISERLWRDIRKSDEVTDATTNFVKGAY